MKIGLFRRTEINFLKKVYKVYLKEHESLNCSSYSLSSTINVKHFWKRSFWTFKSQNFENIYKMNIKIQAILEPYV